MIIQKFCNYLFQCFYWLHWGFGPFEKHMQLKNHITNAKLAIFFAPNWISCSGGPNRTGLTGFTGPVRYPVRFGPVRYFPQIPNRTFLMKCVPKWYLRLDFTFKSSKVAIFFGQISEISFQSHLIFIIQSFRNFEAGYIWKFICYEVRFGKVRFGSVKITGPVRFGKSGICLVRSTTGKCYNNFLYF